MARKPKKPTLEEILELKKYVEKYYQEAHQEWDRDQEYIDRMFAADVPKDMKTIYPPTATIVLDTAREHVPTDNPRIFVPKANDGDEAQGHKEKLRKFHRGLIYRNVAELSISPLDIAVQHLFQYNMGVLKLVYDPFKGDEDSEVYEIQKRSALPIKLRAVNPRTFFPDPSDNPKYVFEIYERDAIEVAAKYPHLNLKLDEENDPRKKVKWAEYHDENYRCFLVDDEPVLKTKVEKHGFGFLNYNWGFAGFGVETPDDNFSKRTQGILRPLRSMFEEEAYLWSVNHEINKSIAWPTTYVMGQNLPHIEKKPGKIITLPEGTKIDRDTPGTQAEGVMTELQMVRNEIFDKTAPRSVRGLPESGVRSGYDRSLLVMEARLRYGSVNTALSKILAQFLCNAARLVELRIPDGITVWGREPDRGEFEEVIKPSDIKGHYVCYVEFAPAEVEDEYRKANTGTMLHDRGVISKTRTREKYAGIIDPEEEEVQVLTDRLTDQMLPLAAQLVQGELAKEIMARQVKEGVSLAQTPTPEEVFAGRGREVAGSPTGAPFVAEEAKPFSPEEERKALDEELGKLE